MQNRCLDPDLQLNWGSFSTDVRLRQYPSLSDTSLWCPWRRRLWRRSRTPGGPLRQAVRLSSCPDRPALSWPDRDLEANLQPEGKGRLVWNAPARLPVFRPMANQRSISSSRQAPAPKATALPQPRASLFDPPTYVRKSPLRQGELCSRLTFISSCVLAVILAALKPVSPKTIEV